MKLKIGDPCWHYFDADIKTQYKPANRLYNKSSTSYNVGHIFKGHYSIDHIIKIQALISEVFAQLLGDSN